MNNNNNNNGNPKTLLEDGNEAVSNVAYCASDALLVSSVCSGRAYLGYECEKWKIQNKKNYNNSLPLVNTLSHTLGTVAIATELISLVNNNLAKPTAVMIASVDLLRCIPDMYILAEKQAKTVFHVETVDIGDVANIMAVRQTGFAMICSQTPQEALDMALVSHIVSTRINSPILHFFSAMTVSDSVTKMRTFSDNFICDLLNSNHNNSNNIININGNAKNILQVKTGASSSSSHGAGDDSAEVGGGGGSKKKEKGDSSTTAETFFQVPLSSKETTLYFQPSFGVSSDKNNSNSNSNNNVDDGEESDKIITNEFINTFNNLSSLFRRRYHPFEYSGAADADLVVVTMGTISSTIDEAVTFVRAATGRRVGVISVRIYRPWSEVNFLDIIPKTCTRVTVLDSGTTIGDAFGPLYLDVTATLHGGNWTGMDSPPSVYSGRIGSSEIAINDAVAVFENLMSPQPRVFFTIGSTSELAKDLLPPSQSLGTISISNSSNNLKSTVPNAVTSVSSPPSLVQDYSTGIIIFDTNSQDRAFHKKATVRMVGAMAKDANVQGYFVISEKVVTTHIHISKTQIKFPSLVADADVIVVTDVSLLKIRNDLLKNLKNGGIFLLCCDWTSLDVVETNLAMHYRYALAAKNARFFIINDKDTLHKSRLEDRLVDVITRATMFRLLGLLSSSSTSSTSSSTSTPTKDSLDIFAENASKLYFNCGINTVVSNEEAIATVSSLTKVIAHVVSRQLPDPSQIHYIASSWKFLLSTPIEDKTAIKENTDFSVYADKPGHFPESPYLKMLAQVFRDRLSLANASKFKTIWGRDHDDVDDDGEDIARGPRNAVIANPESRTVEFGYGIHLAELEQRRSLITIAKKFTDAGYEKNNRFVSLVADLRHWVVIHNDFTASRKAADKITKALETLCSVYDSTVPPEVFEMYRRRHLFQKPSRWLVGGEHWLQDLNSSGLHHLLASGEDIKLLITDTQVYSQNPRRIGGKRDIGLYAMNYGDCYVASVSLFSSYSQAVRCILEADQFNGPAVILAYLPQIRSSPDSVPSAVAAVKESKIAVDRGLWPLYRWNPTADQVFVLDSFRLSKDLESFLDKNNQLSLLVNIKPDLQQSLTSSLESEMAQTHKNLSSFARLKAGLSGGNGSNGNSGSGGGVGAGQQVLVMYGSDGGNAAGIAGRIENSLKSYGFNTECKAMDDVEIGSLSTFQKIVVVVSTAGQGEFPSNSRVFWKTLQAASVEDAGLSESYFAVFGLGDSHYWPRPEDAHYFCKPSLDVDERLDALGGRRLVERGVGDDQADDGFEDGFRKWFLVFMSAMGVADANASAASKKERSPEEVKAASNYLRGTILQGLNDTSTGKISEDDQKLTKFHGIYMQDDRDLREERKTQGLEPAYSFMVRVRVPGGVTSTAQWLAMDEICEKRANGTLKLTTRQAYQIHGVIKKDLKPAIQEINKTLMDTLAACGDVNRNVMCTPNPFQSKCHGAVQKFAEKLSEHLSPRTSAYHEIWLDKKLVAGGEDHEPIYGQTYLPRKFKIAIAIPPSNDTDVFAHCLGFIAVVDEKSEELLGFNISVGGGMGMTHGNRKTFPRRADVMCFATAEQSILVAEKIVVLQRDFGDRSDRKHARFKYTVDDHGVAWVREKIEAAVGYKLEDPRPYKFDSMSDRYGWTKGIGDTWHYGMFIQNGRVKDEAGYPLRTGLREIAKIHKGDFRLSPNQNLIISNVAGEDGKKIIDAKLNEYGIANDRHSGLRLNSMACVALPTCALAMAESERYLPHLIDRLDEAIESCGLKSENIVIRMTGCPNGCARPYMAEIGLVGKAPGIYNMFLGADGKGERVGKLFKENLDEDTIVSILKPLFEKFAVGKKEKESFGDFLIRSDVIKPTLGPIGKNFWDFVE